MATFNHIGGQEPSTINFKLATVSQTRNSSVMHQEIMALGDPDTSNAIAAVLNAVPASTAWALVVRQVGNSSIQGNSTVFQGTSPWVIAGNSTVAPLAGSTWATRPVQSSAADLQMTATQGTSPWVISGASTVAPVAGSTWNTRPIQSSAADLQMTATPAAGSTWRTQPGSTLWASSAGFHFDSSGALQIAGSITATAGSTVSTGFISVRISDGSTWVTDYLQASTFTSTAVAGGANFLRAGASSISSSDVFVMPWGSTFGAQYIIPVTDSGVSVIDSTNRAINVNVVAGSAASTTVNVSSLAGAVITRSSKADSLHTVYQSTAADLNVTVAGYVAPSTTILISTVQGAVITRSSKADSLHTVYQSTAGDLLVTIAGNSTAFQGGAPWTIAGNSTVAPLAGSTWATRPIQSSAADLQVTATIGTNLQSSVAPSSGSSGLVVRQVFDVINTAVSTSALLSTSVSIISSIANIRAYVTAYSITSTNQTPAQWGFYSSNGTQLWALTLAALSSGVAGANLSGYPYLFRTAASEALNFKTQGSSIGGVQLSVSYYNAP